MHVHSVRVLRKIYNLLSHPSGFCKSQRSCMEGRIAVFYTLRLAQPPRELHKSCPRCQVIERDFYKPRNKPDSKDQPDGKQKNITIEEGSIDDTTNYSNAQSQACNPVQHSGRHLASTTRDDEMGMDARDLGRPSHLSPQSLVS